MSILLNLRSKGREIRLDINRVKASIAANRLSAARIDMRLKHLIDCEDWSEASKLDKERIRLTRRADMLVEVKKGLELQQKAIGAFICRLSGVVDLTDSGKFDRAFNRSVALFIKDISLTKEFAGDFK